MYSDTDDLVIQAGFPHSDTPGSKLVCQLPEAFRRLPRPSSPVAAKASTICAWSLDHITPNDFPPAPEVSQESGVMCWSRIQHTLGRGVRTAMPRPASLRLSELLKNPDVSSVLVFDTTCAGAGGANRSRTGDLLRARQALSQLSYGPRPRAIRAKSQACRSYMRSIRRPPVRRNSRGAPWVRRVWWVWVDLNYRPHPYQGCALTD